MAIKVNVDLIQAIAKAKLHNNFRYYIAMCLFDTKRSGHIETEAYIAKITQEFQIKPKTVRNNLQKMANAGWFTMTKTADVMYYRGLNKIMLGLGLRSPGRKAVWIDWDNLHAIKDIRAFCHAVILTNSANEKTISRERITEIAGNCRETQRTYEKYLGVSKQFNYAILAPFNGDNTAWETNAWRENDLTGAGNSVFVGRSPIDGKNYVMRQIPNTYSTSVKLGKRRIDNPASPCVKQGKCQKRYCQDAKMVKEQADRQYVQSKHYSNIWLTYESGVPKC